MRSKFERFITAPTKSLQRWLEKWDSHLAHALHTGKFVPHPDGGVVVFDDKRIHSGFFYRPDPTSNELAFAPNLVVDQGLMKALGILFKSDSKITNWYVALGNGNTSPTAGLTGANVAATMGEITSLSEGYSNVTRPEWTPGSPVANVINNYAAEAVFNIVATTSISATCAFMISSNVRGSSNGGDTLWSAAMFPEGTRTLYNGEPFGLGYQTTLTGV